ncbi:FIST N-terminal domain-containing protein [Actinoplanes sp. NBRC 103695]|uniref:FIST signal transduction protein n=1 Tax=Actinoplanes sp. NBRC 103695 TaxID=3032202 RepID=UPI0025579D4F|nr:FIST N-terminal domain-containing protein [Actinoplanes sp. NBRC 103695]
MQRLPVGSGFSSLDDATAAGAEAARAALGALGGAEPGLVIVYGSIRYDLTALLAAVRGVTGATPLVGASTSGQFADGTYVPAGTAVSVMVLGAGVYRFGASVVTGVGADALAAGRELARGAMDAAGGDTTPHSALMVLADGMAGDMQSLLTGIYRVTGARVPVVGGAAGDDRTFSGSYVFFGDQAMRDAAVAVWIGSERPLRVVSGHGWKPKTLPMLVTRVNGMEVEEIDGRPAAAVFTEVISQRTSGEARNFEGAYDGWDTGHSFGLIEPDGTQLIRGAFVGEDGALRTFVPLPEYCAVQFVSADQDDLLNASEEVVDDALRDVSAPAVMLMFSCIARIDLLAVRAGEEAARLHKAAGQVATFGFYTYGEFARSTGVAGYHNATLTAIAL